MQMMISAADYSQQVSHTMITLSRCIRFIQIQHHWPMEHVQVIGILQKGSETLFIIQRYLEHLQ